ncbi:protein BLISTER isoform X2 [Punica granatum]|uniref:Protein BLISTER isoform X2 n=1 Tax=Punica granatum TaxID=22663 RepID=A0A218XHG7_PUNGR|nr:protein BLISTER isoform X2 [Punica granatum]OWM84258.1 hypothetical protein CDL15_Pgr011643 [Punica granatum]
MASAQVLPSSRKHEHLAAGKRRLEEFRKKKAADRAKKSSSSNVADVTVNEKRPSDTQVNLSANSDAFIQQPSISEINNGPSDISEQDSGFPINDTADTLSRTLDHMHSKDEVYNKHYEISRSNGPVDYIINQDSKETEDDSGIFRGSRYGLTSDHDSKGIEETIGIENNSNLKDFSFKIPESSPDLVANNVNSQRFPSFPQQTKSTNASPLPWAITSPSFNEEAYQPSSTKGSAPESGLLVFDVARSDDSAKFDIDERKLSSSFSGLPGVQSSAPYTSSQYSSAAYSSDHSNSSDHTPLYTPISEAHPRRSRPSFLDSLNVPRASPAFPSKYAESKELTSGNDAGNSMDSLSQSAFGTRYTDNLATSTTAISNEEHISDAGGRCVEKKPEFYLPKQDEDFAALEQHIEDLTQEKFSLQRALEASRALAESLASENSSLTDSYNQQRGAVNQLKADMEKLQEEISTQLAELESLRHEYANAQLECNAADERAKLLASEVIGLEEKALRLRSSELKLERQLENSQAEIAAYKKKVSSLEKDRLDLQSTISALQEEKKVLQSKLRKSSTSGKSIEVSQSCSNRKDISTSTDDLDASINTSSQQTEHSGSVLDNDASSSLSLSDTLQLNVEASFAYIPPDQLRMIENINTIVSELALEKEELVKALASKTSDNSKLKDLNRELSRKLEAQTQRLELLTAQSMANGSMPAKLPDAHAVLDNTAYADEGDEVVERVLGWIMKLFPGGPSRRRSSKLL